MSNIEWTDRTWNPIRGCSRVSEGCRHCYAETIAGRFSLPGNTFHGFAERTPEGPRWTGQVTLLEDKLQEPLRWRESQRVFVNSMSDLFHENLPDEAIDRVFAVMAVATRHTFQILTKRAERMRDYLSTARARIADVIGGGALDLRLDYSQRSDVANRILGQCIAGTDESGLPTWPLSNVWLGVSVENQAAANERIPLLNRTLASVRFVSAEPLLEKLLLDYGYNSWLSCTSTLTEDDYESMPPDQQMNHHCCESFDAGGTPHFHGIDWVIVGGESGPGARPFDVAWARSIVTQCKAAGVACFVKQLGAVPMAEREVGTAKGGCHLPLKLHSKKGGDMSEWPEDLRVREFPVRSKGATA